MSAQKAFDAIADPVRREILRLLVDHDECSVSQLAESIHSVGRTGVSTHLRVLRTAGLVTERKAGRFRLYSVDATGPARDVLVEMHELFRDFPTGSGQSATGCVPAGPGVSGANESTPNVYSPRLGTVFRSRK